MFEGWAADVLASYLGKYLDLPRDRLRISLWGGGCMAGRQGPIKTTDAPSTTHCSRSSPNDGPHAR